MGRGETIDVRGGWRFESDRFAPQTFTRAMWWLERHYKEDFFLYIDAWDPHEPFDAPDYYTELYWPGYDGEYRKPVYGYWQDAPDMTEEKVKKSHAAYCGEITMVDTWIGYFVRHLENMGLMEKTAIIFTTDHGFNFGEHGGLFGKFVRASQPEASGLKHSAAGAGWAHSPLYEEVIACPLFIYVPNIPPGVYSGLTSAVDLMPTVLDIVGQEIPSCVEGQSLLPMMQDSSAAGREYIVSGSPFANQGDTVRFVDDQSRPMAEASDTTVTTDEWSLLYNVEPGVSELYHLASDPKQEKNVIAQHPEVAHDLHQLLVSFMRETDLSPRLREPRLELRL